jgi:hypothetical protein
MAATATSSATIPASRTAPLISPEVRAQLAQERKRLAADPDRSTIPAELHLTAKYVFRAKAGTHRRITHRLPMPPEEAAYGDEKRYKFNKRRWDAIVAHKRYPDLTRDKAAEKLTAELDAVRDELADAKFKFTQIPRHVECFYATNSDVVGSYIMDLMDRKVGEFARVYREANRSRVVVGLGTDLAEAFPNTEGGWRLARQYANTHGITNIELVGEE